MSTVPLEDFPGWVSEGKCSGECCRLISLNTPPELVAEMAAGARHRERFPGAQVRHATHEGDPLFVVRHFTPVRYSYIDGVTGERSFEPEPRMQYRCEKWSGKRCNAYDERPMLCRTYGITATCRRADCTLRPYPLYRDLESWDNEGGSVPLLR